MSDNTNSIKSFFSSNKLYWNKISNANTTYELQLNDLLKENYIKIKNIFFTSLFAFIGLLLVSILDNFFINKFNINNETFSILTGAYAATSVLIYDDFAIKSPLAQPKNVIGSYVIGSIIGVTTRIICEKILVNQYISGPFAVSIALIFMNCIDIVHPPGGACTLIAVIGGPKIFNMGYYYVLTSFCGSSLIVLWAIIANNIIENRHYPYEKGYFDFKYRS
jgi:CBS-domain-containing membrane protein